MDGHAKTLVLVARLAGLGLLLYIVRWPLGALIDESWGLQFVRGLRLGSVVGVIVKAVPVLLLLALAVHLTFGGRWLIARMLRGLDGSCPACGHAPPERGERCTECGFRFWRQL